MSEIHEFVIDEANSPSDKELTTELQFDRDSFQMFLDILGGEGFNVILIVGDNHRKALELSLWLGKKPRSNEHVVSASDIYSVYTNSTKTKIGKALRKVLCLDDLTTKPGAPTKTLIFVLNPQSLDKSVFASITVCADKYRGFGARWFIVTGEIL